MNNPSPLVPQGSLQEQKNQSRARVKIAVFVVLAIHGLGLLALLIQGCQPKEAVPEVPLVDTNPPPAMEMTNIPPVDTNPPSMSATTPPVAEPPPVVTPTPLPISEATTYTVAKGDTLDGIAKKSHITLKALLEANPGVQPTKLQIGQKLQIPAASGTPAVAAQSDAVPTTTVYTVKSGDTLTKIAGHFSVTLKALRSANGLKTDSIKVGQKLKIPVKTAAPVPTPMPTTPAPTLPEPTPVPTPSPTPTPTPGQ